MASRSIRGAITVTSNDKKEILEATEIMLSDMMKKNGLQAEDIISILFTATKDLDEVYPAVAARELGVTEAGLMCMQELFVEGSLGKCIRAMMLVETDKKQSEMSHIYLREAKRLRPDLISHFAIAIDGPSGAGKSTIARMLAKELDFIYVDTGAMYRAVALYGLRNGYNLSRHMEIMSYMDNISIEIKSASEGQRILLNGEDVTEGLRTQAVADGSSKVAEVEKVREKLVELQRKIARDNDVVMDGRDIGTVVLPNAQVKIFMDAQVSERSRRRVSELTQKGIAADADVIEREIIERDERDRTREHSPLTMAAEAILLDTTHMDAQQVMNRIITLVRGTPLIP